MTDDTRMDEDKMDQLLREAAAGYNAPPETPRAEIWERISAARRVERNHNAVAPVARLLTSPTWRVAAAIAAILIVVVVVGRFTAPNGRNGPLAAGESLTDVELAAISQVAYRVVATEHLSRVETFLTLFQADARAGRTEEMEYAVPARSLLLSTRLLQDSPIADDLALQTLLDDVELVLAQIAQFTADHVEDLEFIDHGISQRSVLLKLRSAIPAGPPRVSAEGAM